MASQAIHSTMQKKMKKNLWKKTPWFWHQRYLNEQAGQEYDRLFKQKENYQSFIKRYGFIGFTGDSIGGMDKENWDTSSIYSREVNYWLMEAALFNAA
jgi:hypothetical protein